ncbi:hypothetical protein QTP88_011402 [Uroleucon formosanum]
MVESVALVQDTRRLVPEETSFEPQTNIINNEQTAIISENNDILAFSEEPYNDQNSVYNSSEMPDDSGIFENTFLITSESPIKPTPSHSSEITGRRIINLMHFIKQIQEIDHTPFSCSFKDMLLESERRHGFMSSFNFKCKMCNKKCVIETEDEKSNMIKINTAAVIGIVNTGGGYGQIKEIMTTLEIPIMNNNTYNKEHDIVCEKFEEAATQTMYTAAKEEARLAIEAGDVDIDGVPLIAVVADGSWCKRSYRTMYNSLSGTAAIIGYRTKKVIFLGIRNKFCCMCAKNKNEPKKHECWKNWSMNDSSAGMETSIVVEGFRKSEEMYGLRYHKLIADGDSSVYKKILDARPYKNITVEKVECRNHLLRNVCNKLRELTTKKQSGQLVHRKLLSSRILRIRKGIIKAIQYRKSNCHSINDLRNDIYNSINHVFGNHSNCALYFCNKPKEDINLLEKIQHTDNDFYVNMNSIIRQLGRHSKSLMQDVDSNIVESYNSIIAKVIGGKRVNYALKRSYVGRCYAATVAKNSRRPIYSMYKVINKISPNPKTHSILYEQRKLQKQERQNEHRRQNKRFKKKLFDDQKINSSYGEGAEKPDMDKNEYSEEKKQFLKLLKEMAEKREYIEKETRNQCNSNLWIETRRKLITASNFGQIIGLRPHTGCGNTIKSLIYSNTNTPAMEYGRQHESIAKCQVEKELKIKITECGLFIHPEYFYLGATPDGLIGNDGILEIKCPSSSENMTPNEGIKNGKITFWKKDKEGVATEINKNHKYYAQIQGQLYITQREYCIIAFWTKKGLKTEKLFKDEIFWNEKMLPKLSQFYYNCLLPELIDPRYPRNMPIRNPDYIIEAQKKLIEKKN